MSCLLSMLLSVVVLTAAAAAAAVSEAQYDDFTPAPDYDGDYNATFDYSFYSNTSSDDLDLFSNRFFEGDEDEEDTGGPETTPTQRPVEGVTVATTRPTTEQSRVGVRSAASLPVSSELWILIWTLTTLILISHRLQQHTL
ncbi:uncharacterized protein V6R79_017471 [Siganus canaliculatus]